MKLIERDSIVAPLAVAGVLGIAVVIAILLTRSNLPALRVLAGAPRATLSAPRAGPAVYAGNLHALKERATPLGTRAAALWWWVVRHSKNGGCGKAPPTVCKSFESHDLVLRADGAQVSLDMFADEHGISLVSDRRDEWDERRFIDIGSRSAKTQTQVPAPVARCEGHGTEYQEIVLPEGAAVEVFGCHTGRAIAPCDGPVAGVLAAAPLSVHVAHRVGHAHGPMRAVTAAGLVALIGLAIHAGRMRTRRHAIEPRPADLPGAVT